MKITRLHILLFLAALCVFGLFFRRKITGAINACQLLIKGKKTVSQRIDEFGDIVRNRLTEDFNKTGISYPPASMVFIGLKAEKRLEVWVSQDRQSYHLLKTYPILKASGKAGPKLREGDQQVPEGFYTIESLNPNSRFHLSLKLDYPNDFDQQMAQKDARTDIGGDIMIHGCQVSIGCLAMGDTTAEDLFVMAALTKPENIKVIICPVDFRVRDFDGDYSKLPNWVPELYQQIKTELLKYK
jgi:murein L,D-transpeptidase YafK